MNKLAVCISGQARDDGTWIQDLVHKLEVYEPDYFISIYDGEFTQKYLGNVKHSSYNILPTDNREFFLNKFLSSYANLNENTFEVLNKFDRKRGIPQRDNVFRMLYAIQDSNYLQVSSQEEYEYILRIRPDAHVRSSSLPLKKLRDNEIGVPMNSFGTNYYSSDKAFIGLSQIMNKVSNFIDDLPKIMEKYDKENPLFEPDRWLEPEITLHWGIANFYDGVTVGMEGWDIDRYRVDYRRFVPGKIV